MPSPVSIKDVQLNSDDGPLDAALTRFIDELESLGPVTLSIRGPIAQARRGLLALCRSPHAFNLERLKLKLGRHETLDLDALLALTQSPRFSSDLVFHVHESPGLGDLFRFFHDGVSRFTFHDDTRDDRIVDAMCSHRNMMKLKELCIKSALSPWAFERLVCSPHVRELKMLSVAYSGIFFSASSAAVISTSSQLSGLKALEFPRLQLSLDAIFSLATSERLPSLQIFSLPLYRPKLDKEVIHSLLTGFRETKNIELSGEKITDEAIASLLETAPLHRLEKITLRSTAVTTSGLRALIGALSAEERFTLVHDLGETPEDLCALINSTLFSSAIHIETPCCVSRQSGAQRELFLSGSAVDDAVLEALAGSARLSRLTHLTIRRASASVDGFRALFGAVNAVCIEGLTLEGCGLRNDGLRALAGSFFPALQSLELKKCRLQVSGLRALAASKNLTHLRVLDLSENKPRRSGLLALLGSPRLGALRTLVLNDVGLDGPMFAALCASERFSTLTSLSVDQNDLDDEKFSDGLEAISSPADLLSLSARDNGLTDIVAEAVAATPHLSGLRCLDVSGNWIGDAGARALIGSAALKNLVRLNLDRNRVEVERVRALGMSAGVEVVCSRRRAGQRVEAAAVAAPVPAQLSLSAQRAGDWSKQRQRLFRDRSAAPLLLALSHRHHDVLGEAVAWAALDQSAMSWRHLCDLASRLSSADLSVLDRALSDWPAELRVASRAWPLGSPLHRLARCFDARDLTSEQVIERRVEQKKSEHLRHLNALLLQNVRTEDARRLLDARVFQGIRALDLSWQSRYHRGDPVALELLLSSGQLNDVEALNIQGYPLDEAWLFDRQFLNLRRLSFDHGVGKNHLVEALRASSLTKLESLRCSRVSILPEAIDALMNDARFSALRTLGLTNAHLSVDALKRLGEAERLKNIHALDLSGGHMGHSGLRELVTSPRIVNLRRLHLGRNNLDNNAIKTLARSVYMSRLEGLNLARNSFTGLGVKHLTTSPYIKGLRRLILDHNRCDAVGRRALLSATAFSQLHTLSATSCILRRVDGFLTAKNFPRLHALHLDDNKATDHDASADSASLSLPRLRHLSLSANDVRGAFIAWLVSSPRFAGVRSLDLRGNFIAPEVGLAIARSAHVTGLRSLEITRRHAPAQVAAPTFNDDVCLVIALSETLDRALRRDLLEQFELVGAELKNLAARLRVVGRSKMNKAQLLSGLQAALV